MLVAEQTHIFDADGHASVVSIQSKIIAKEGDRLRARPRYRVADTGAVFAQLPETSPIKIAIKSSPATFEVTDA